MVGAAATTWNNTTLCEEVLPVWGKAGTNQERTFLAVKPDGVQRGLIGDIIARFEKRGYKLVGLKMVWPSEEMAKEHYADLSTKKFFGGLTKFFSSGPVVCMCWEGKDIIKQGRQMLGETQPLASKPGSIRGDFSIDLGRNICHGSDSPEAAQHELKMWFPVSRCMFFCNDLGWILVFLHHFFALSNYLLCRRASTIGARVSILLFTSKHLETFHRNLDDFVTSTKLFHCHRVFVRSKAVSSKTRNSGMH